MTNRERLQLLLADGEWHGIEEIDEVAGRQSGRTRMSELVKLHGSKHKPLPDGSWLYERRFRIRHEGKVYQYNATDWRQVANASLF
jgi:hypothetical protein